jgi:hypothetical protein
MEDWIEKVLLKWRSEGVKLNPPASLLEIERVAAVLDFKFPDDFKALYLHMDGFADWDMQEHGFSFWPLDRIVKEFNENDNNPFIGFCDWLVGCIIIGFMRNETGIFKDRDYYVVDRPKNLGNIITVTDYNGKPQQYLNVIDRIADNFNDVVLMIESGDGAIY